MNKIKTLAWLVVALIALVVVFQVYNARKGKSTATTEAEKNTTATEKNPAEEK